MLDKLERRSDWEIALWVTAIMRVAYSAVAAVAFVVLHPDAQRVQTNFTGEMVNFTGAGYALAGVWQRFDTLLYLHIASHGYDQPALTVFYPLYPSLIRLLSPPCGPLIAALLISTLSAFFLFLGFYRLAALDLPKAFALRSLLLYAAWPASFIFFAGYAESLTIALVVWSVYLARKSRWWLAGISGFFAGLARAAGGLAVLPLLVIAWKRRRERPWPVLWALVGAVAYPLWLQWAKHTSIAEIYRHSWRIQIVPPWFTMGQVLLTLVRHPDSILLLNVLILVVIAILSVWARPRPEYPLYALTVILQMMTRFERPLLLGCPRYLLLVFPAYIAVGGCLEKSARVRRYFWPLWSLLLFANLGFMWAFLNWSLEL